MRDATRLPVTVKHRIGIDQDEDYGFVRDFVGTVAEAGCEVFIVHARNAWLKGLSPKENRDIPPLRHATVHQLKRDFPALVFVINGGITTAEQIDEQLQHARRRDARPRGVPQPLADGRLGRALVRRAGAQPLERAAVEAQMVGYMRRAAARPASRGRMCRATCSACGTANPARGAGARSGRTIA